MKQKFLRLSTMVIAMMACVSSFAYDACIDGIYYNIIVKAKQAEVTHGDKNYTGSVTIPETITYNGVTYSVTSIGNYAFYNCSGLTSVTIPNSVTVIGENAFHYCEGMKSVTIGNSVTSIGENAFSECSRLTSITIPNSVTSIGGSACSSCTGLTSVTIPNSVTSMGEKAFYNCSALTSVTIGNSVTSIGEAAFQYCSALTSVTIGNSVTVIGEAAFQYCSDLTTVTIPNSVTSIGWYAFYKCSGLTSVTIGNSVTIIGVGAFYNCSALTSVIIPNSVTSIYNGAFCNCSALTSVTIPNSVTVIGAIAFSGCTGLTSVTIGNSVTGISSEAFSGCKNIENVYCYAEKVPSTGTDVFKDAYTEYATLYVPENSMSNYMNAEPWRNFGTIKAIVGGDVTPDSCATPTISIVNGKLHFECETEGAQIHYTVTQKSNDLSADYDGEDIDFMKRPSYTITAYATADGYIDSEKVTKTITANNADVNGDGTVDISDVNGVISVICGSNVVKDIDTEEIKTDDGFAAKKK